MISRREFGSLAMAGFATQIATQIASEAAFAQHAAIAAQRLRQQKSRRAFHRQRRRMKLHILHIHDPGACTISHGDAIASS